MLIEVEPNVGTAATVLFKVGMLRQRARGGAGSSPKNHRRRRATYLRVGDRRKRHLRRRAAAARLAPRTTPVGRPGRHPSDWLPGAYSNNSGGAQRWANTGCDYNAGCCQGNQDTSNEFKLKADEHKYETFSGFKVSNEFEVFREFNGFEGFN